MKQQFDWETIKQNHKDTTYIIRYTNRFIVFFAVGLLLKLVSAISLGPEGLELLSTIVLCGGFLYFTVHYYVSFRVLFSDYTSQRQ
jgi:hypothetical protein